MLVCGQRQKPPVLQQGGIACADPQSGPTQLPDLPPELQTAEHRRDADLGSLLDKLSGSIGRRQRVAARDQVGFTRHLELEQRSGSIGRRRQLALRDQVGFPSHLDLGSRAASAGLSCETCITKGQQVSTLLQMDSAGSRGCV